MTNPTPQTASVNLPPSTAPLIDLSTGAATPQFYFILLGLQTRTGGVSGVDLTAVKTTSDEALALAGTANTTAHAALTTANTAETTATNAQTTANTALNNANGAATIANGARVNSLQKALNLSDLTLPSLARLNLGVSSLPLWFRFDTLTVGQSVPWPVTRAFTIPANFAGFGTWANTFPSADAVFTLKVNTTTVGTITLIHSGNFSSASTQPAFNVAVGDTIHLVAPNPADSTLAGVGIVIPLTLA